VKNNEHIICAPKVIVLVGLLFTNQTGNYLVWINNRLIFQ